MPKKIVRKLELYAIHAHNATPIDYQDIFSRLSNIDPSRRLAAVSNLVVAFPIVEKDGGNYFIQVTEGDPEAAALLLDRNTGQTREVDLSDTEIISQATHLLVNPEHRRASVEYVRRGAKAVIISAAIEIILRRTYKDYKDLSLSFNPVIDEDFIRQISNFERIRHASLRVTRPNASWTDHYSELSEFMEESNGSKVEIDVRAGRNETLSPKGGIVGAIKEVASDSQPYLDNARITGTRKGETEETTISSRNSVRHTRTSLQSDDAGVPVRRDIISKLARLMNIGLGL